MKADVGLFGAGFQVPEGGDVSLASIIPVRVTDIVLDEINPLWTTQGGWDTLGLIKFSPVYGNQNDDNNNYAKPLFANIKNYPLLEEIVYILQLPDPSISTSPNKSSWYYINSINLWNHPHHNALPNVDFSSLPSNTQLNYKEIETGVIRTQSTNSLDFSFGKTFVENPKIRPVLPFEGDVIFEGRFGQSFRFGSSVKQKNPWSLSPEVQNGDPIIIIKNGQTVDTSKPIKGWIPILEDVNNDGSSIYMTQGQAIPIKIASKNWDSFKITLQENSQPVLTIPDNPTLPITVPLSAQVIPSVEVTTGSALSTNSGILLPEVTIQSTYTEDQLSFHFPGEEPPTFIFDIDSIDEELPIQAIIPVKYSAVILSNESVQTKIDNTQYIPYKGGIPLAPTPISYIDKIRVADSHKDFISRMLDQARKEGIIIALTDGFRTFDEQVALRRKNVIDKSKTTDDNYILNQPSNKFNPLTGKPGFSNHQNGQAFDININAPGVYQWLKPTSVGGLGNASKFGFIRTIGTNPPSKAEPWHWEYLPGTPEFQYVKQEDQSWYI